MYRIQAYNVALKCFEIYRCSTMEERNKIMKELQSNQDYGLVTFEYLARGWSIW